ncbi:MAG: phosphatidylserine decarboxylase [Bacteroidales bacterium]|nr:phosphatidylserine decarboxylase [Bacteroidales bacterium]
MNKKKRLLFILVILLGVFLYPFHNAEPIQYIDRVDGELKIEKVPGEYWLNWLYNNPIGELSLQAFVKRKALSDWYGDRMDLPESAKKVNAFVKEYNIDLSIAQKQEFLSFNDFFYRKLKPTARPISGDSTIIISPADGKLLAYDNIDKQDFIVKGYKFNLAEYLHDSLLTKQFTGGSLVIVRLCPTDYHRFHFPTSGTIQSKAQISGDLYSVSPIALRKKIELICMNKREYVIINNTIIGDYMYSEVGATMVGSIIQTYENENVIKGQEKGYFKFGGSTVILLFEKGRIIIDQDLLENTQKGIETAILMGDQLGSSS